MTVSVLQFMLQSGLLYNYLFYILTSEDGRLCCLSLRVALNDSNQAVWSCDALKQVAPWLAQILCPETAELDEK